MWCNTSLAYKSEAGLEGEHEYLIGRTWSSALNVRQGEDASLAANEQGAGELGVEPQQAGPRPEGYCVQQPWRRAQVKHLHQKQRMDTVE